MYGRILILGGSLSLKFYSYEDGEYYDFNMQPNDECHCSMLERTITPKAHHVIYNKELRYDMEMFSLSLNTELWKFKKKITFDDFVNVINAIDKELES